MHFFIKKTNELAKKQKMPKEVIGKQIKNGIYVRVLLGNRKDKSFLIYKNQLKTIDADTPLSTFEINCLKKVYANNDEWKKVCNIIKNSRGNKYPKDWISTLRRENLMIDASQNETEKGESKQIVDIIMNGLLKSINVEQPGVSHVPTIILLETENDLFKKKFENKKIDQEKIFLESYIEGTNEKNRNIDFIARFNENSLVDLSLLINKNSEFEFGLPFSNVKIKNNMPYKNTKELYHWLKENIVKNISNVSDSFTNVTIDDLGIDYIKKVENKNNCYFVQFLY